MSGETSGLSGALWAAARLAAVCGWQEPLKRLEDARDYQAVRGVARERLADALRAAPLKDVVARLQERRHSNQQAVLAQAVELLVLGAPTVVGDSTPSADEETRSIDPDWFSRFMSHAEHISEAHMQSLWAELLAGEAHRPGRYSRRTLSVVADLDREQVVAFERIATTVLWNSTSAWTLRLDDLPDWFDCGHSFDDVVLATNAGLISAVRDGMYFVDSEDSYNIGGGGDVLVVLPSMGAVRASPFTRAGCELVPLAARHRPVLPAFIEVLGLLLKDHGMCFRIDRAAGAGPLDGSILEAPADQPGPAANRESPKGDV